MDVNVSFPLGWESLCVICALIGFFMAVLVHMAAKAMGLQNLDMWAKSEYMQAGASFLIILLAIGMVQAGGRIATEITSKLAEASDNVELLGAAANPVNIGDPVRIAKAYLTEGPLKCEVNMYKWARRLNTWAEFWNGISISVGNVEGTGGGFFYAGRVSVTHYAAQSITYLALFHYIQYHMLNFSQYVMLQIFLPIGIILRTFAPTRGTGGFMIAFALGFAFVFPISYLFIVAMMPSTAIACSQIGVQADYISNAGKAGFAEEFLVDDPCPNNAGATVMNMMKSEGDTTMQSELTRLQRSVGQLYLQAVFYPMVCLIVTFTFIRQTSSLFGADLAEIGRGLIKII
ncbi:MAG: hypothetical protein WCT52_00130 [Candidatus Micrarchaeia archaeon]